jgi:hypothetical protein
MNGVWAQAIKTNFLMKAMLGDRTTFNINYYAIMLLTTPNDPNIPTPRRAGGGGLQDVYFNFKFGQADSTSASLTAGIFPYDYTYRWQQLGGYLFRTGVYPGYILPTYYERAVQGACLSIFLPEVLRHDLILTVETEIQPLYDISLSYMGHLKVGGLNMDLGGMLYRLLRTDQGHYNEQQSKPMQQFRIIDTTDIRLYTIQNTESWDSTKHGNYFTKSGIKLVGRLSFDFKSLMKSTRLSDEDMVLYVEAAILGLKDYPGFYNKLIERIPLTAGFTFPAFGLLDGLGVEMEYYSSRWNNNQPELAIPYYVYDWRNPASGHDVVDKYVYVEDQNGGDKALSDNFKWAIFAEKIIKNKYHIAVHVASDHFRSPEAGGVGAEELLYAPDEWYWQITLKTVF